jgi:hypothetical protein
MLPIMGNMTSIGNSPERAAAEVLRKRLPPGWKVTQPSSRTGPDLVLNAPDGRKVLIEVKGARQIEPKAAAELARGARKQLGSSTILVVASFLSPRTREVLLDSNLAYLDLTGNVRLVSAEPGLFIETTGAALNPNPNERPSRGLKGEKAARVIRHLVDFAKFPGVRALANATGANPGYVSRLLAFLENEALVHKEASGSVSVRWDVLLRHWAEVAPLSSRGDSATFIDPRGIPNFLGRLTMVHAITGSLAAAKIAPVASPRFATIYVNHVRDAAQLLGLRDADSGANVRLIAPKDSFVFERTVQRDGLVYAAPSQVAADLLSSPGRGPAEGEALIEWMKAHEEAWRG